MLTSVFLLIFLAFHRDYIFRRLLLVFFSTQEELSAHRAHSALWAHSIGVVGIFVNSQGAFGSRGAFGSISALYWSCWYFFQLTRRIRLYRSILLELLVFFQLARCIRLYRTIRRAKDTPSCRFQRQPRAPPLESTGFTRKLTAYFESRGRNPLFLFVSRTGSLLFVFKDNAPALLFRLAFSSLSHR